MYEKFARLPTADNILHKRIAPKKCGESKQTARKMGEKFLTTLGLLSLQRVPLPPQNSIPGIHERVKFYYTPCRRMDPDHARKASAEKLLDSLDTCDFEI